MSRKEYNLVVIGGGAAGLVAAYLAAALRAKVALVERHRMGGDCLYTGCVPSKALLRTAKVLSLTAPERARSLGLRSLRAEFDFAEVMERVRGVIRRIEPNDSRERYARLGVDCLEGEARLAAGGAVRVGDRELTARAVVLATGATPVVPAIPGLSGARTSDTIWDLRTLPQRLLVLGGGAIGCELAQAFRRLGAEVTIVEKGPRLLGREDADAAAVVEGRLRAEGVRVLCGAEAVRFDGRAAVLHDGTRLEHDEVLVALGRRARTAGLGLESAGVRLRANGTIDADRYLRTSAPGIYAAGDCTGPLQFTHFASLSGSTAALNALLAPYRRPLDLSAFPMAAYTDPELARVGLSEAEATAHGIPFEVTRHELRELDRALADGTEEGFVKVLTEPGRDRILGATIVGASAGELITEFTLAMRHGLGLRAILGTVHPYPTLMEANRFAAGAWTRAHASPLGLRLLAGWHAWRRNF